MKKHILWIALTAINIALGVFLYRQKNIISQFYNDYDVKSSLSYDYTKSMLYNGLVLDSATSLLDNKDSLYTLGNLIDAKRKLVFRYSFIHCNVCVDTLMKFVNKFADEVGKDNVVIFAQYANKRDYKNFVRINQVKTSIYHLQDSLCKADELSIPYLFILEDNMTVSNFFMPRKEYPKITEQYLQSIKNILTK